MKTILACTDLSDGAHQALIRAIAIAARAQAALTILHSASEDDGALDQVRKAIRTFAQKEAETIGARALDIHVRIRMLDPRRAILEEAERIGADLIVLGGHGKPRFRDAIFGTIGTHLARHASIPVLVVQTDPALSYSKLLVAADAPDAAARLAQSALAVAPTGEIFTVHAVPPSIGQALFCPDSRAGEFSRQERTLKSALTRIATAHPRALLDAKGHILVEEGDALTVIMDKTDELLPDLVVMGTHHRGTFVGSRGVDALFWCPADLLIVPDPVAARAAA